MTSSFVVQLDTTAPALGVVASADPGDPTLLTLAIDPGDAVDIRLFGAIEVTDPINSLFGEDEASSPWLSATTKLQVRLTALGGTITVQARDEVWNQSEVTKTFAGTAEPPPVTPPPQRSPGGLPRTSGQPGAEPEVRVLRSVDSARASEQGQAPRVEVVSSGNLVTASISSRVTASSAGRAQAVQHRTIVGRIRVTSSGVIETTPADESSAVRRRTEGAEAETAALLALGMLPA